MSLELLVPVVAASLFGSLHCAGMCGGFVAMVGDGVPRSGRLATQLTYNLGRLISYACLGAAAGSLGHAVDLAGKAAGLGRVAAIASGGLMITWGIVALLATQGVSLWRGRFHLPARLTRGLASLRDRPPLGRALAMGLATTLLPCGWLYAFAVSAAGTASPVSGALLMGAFWAGNLPTLLGLGVALSAALARVRRHIPVLSAAVIFCIGLFTLSMRANLPAFAGSAIAACHRGGTPVVPTAGACPCHRKRM